MYKRWGGINQRKVYSFRQKEENKKAVSEEAGMLKTVKGQCV